MAGYEYDVVIKGLDGIPLRTTNKGAQSLLAAFQPDGTKVNTQLQAVDKGRPFANTFVSVAKKIKAKKLAKKKKGK